MQVLKAHSRASKNFAQVMDARKSRFAQTQLIRYAPKEQDTLIRFDRIAAFKYPLTLDIGYLSSL